MSAEFSTTVTGELEDADELLIEQDFGVNVFGYDVPLGIGVAHIRVDIVGQVRGEQADESRVTFRLADQDQAVSFELRPPEGYAPYKRTLRPGEAPPVLPPPAFPVDWMAGEKEADQELRSGGGIRFSSEDAFFAWLKDPSEVPAD